MRPANTHPSIDRRRTRIDGYRYTTTRIDIDAATHRDFDCNSVSDTDCDINTTTHRDFNRNSVSDTDPHTEAHGYIWSFADATRNCDAKANGDTAIAGQLLDH